MKPEPFTYAAKCVAVHDGDTVTLNVDLGFRLCQRGLAIRLNGINAPELNTDAGKAAQAWLASRLLNQDVTLHSIMDRQEKYGRILGEIWLGDENVNMSLVAAGHAKYWDGKGARP